MAAPEAAPSQGADRPVVLPLPPQVPRVRSGRALRWIARSLLRLGGWRMAGSFPDIPKLVLIGAPHTSNWDGIWGMLVKVALGLDIRIFAKRELFWWPLGPILRGLGVIPVDRTAARGLIEQMLERFEREDRFWLGIAPEGTRKRVERWKPGFWKIASAAGVPVLPAYFHYPEKIIGIGEPFHLTGDMDADMARIRAWYAPWRGKHRGV
ncbi:lysophospholipid acyltransferase family protein [Lysobacter brunescens]|uniref:Lysophospholipid acyltransferase family protein n=1 Tax=Lysobacter brunescens TaxID=262323 RepID=A0ABW2YAW9_9GAMM